MIQRRSASFQSVENIDPLLETQGPKKTDGTGTAAFWLRDSNLAIEYLGIHSGIGIRIIMALDSKSRK